MSWIFYGSSLGLLLLGVVIRRFHWVHLLANAKAVPHADQRKVARLAASYLMGLGLLLLLVGYGLTRLTHVQPLVVLACSIPILYAVVLGYLVLISRYTK